MKPAKIVVVLLAIFVGAVVVAADSKPEEIIAVLKDYRQALKNGDIDMAIKMTATFPKYPAAAIREDTVRYSELSASGELHFWIFPSSCKVIEECAVVLLGDNLSPSADDPGYLLKQDGKWKIIPALTDWEDDYIELTNKQKISFQKLAEHVSNQKRILRSSDSPTIE